MPSAGKRAGKGRTVQGPDQATACQTGGGVGVGARIEGVVGGGNSDVLGEEKRLMRRNQRPNLTCMNVNISYLECPSLP